MRRNARMAGAQTTQDERADTSFKKIDSALGHADIGVDAAQMDGSHPTHFEPAHQGF